jgi:hypothetical protein
MTTPRRIGENHGWRENTLEGFIADRAIASSRMGDRSWAMPSNVSYETGDGIVVVRISGDVGEEEHLAAREKAIRLCRENHCAKLLVDLRDLNTTRISITDSYSFGETVAKAISPLRLAHVLPQDAKAVMDVKFISTVEANRGVNADVFVSVEDARKWLLT